MLRKIILFILLILNLYCESLDIKNITYSMENDADFRNDQDYTYGAETSILLYRNNIDESFLHIPFTNYKNQDNYISFSYAQKIYTPKDLESYDLIDNDRPYAGYVYIKSGLYQSYKNTLKSLVLQLGLIGPSTNMDSIQKLIHSTIGSDSPNGWDNQLKNEFIMQVNYSQKHYIPLSSRSAITPEYGFELGNASTKIFAAALYRWGMLSQDYGSSQIDNVTYNKIPLSPKKVYKNQWSYCFNFSLKGNIIARDIFLDGNTFRDSHSVEKNIFVAEVGYGISINYEKFSIDYLRKHLSKEFKTQDRFPNYGSLIFSYNF